MESKEHNGTWTRFIDSLPPIGEEIMVAWANDSFGGMVFASSGKMVDGEHVMIDSFDYPFPVYGTSNFRLVTLPFRPSGMSYAHHWAHLSTDRKTLQKDLTRIDDRNRKDRKEKIPVKLIKKGSVKTVPPVKLINQHKYL